LNAIDDGIAHAADAAERRRLLAERYRIAQDAGDTDAAASSALRLFDDYRAFAEAETCALDVTQSPPSRKAAGNSTRMLLACGEVFLARDRAQDLRRVLSELDTRKLAGEQNEHRRILWCEYRYQTGDFARAISLASPSYSEPTFKRRSMILMARSLRSGGRKAEAAAVYERFARVFPNDVLAPDALFAAASLRDGNRQPRESARLLDELRRSYPSSFHGWAAAMRRAEDLREAGQTGEAAAIYEQWLARSRRTDEAALFYLSRLYESNQSDDSANLLLDELRRVNPYSFYVSPDVGTLSRGPLRDASGAAGATSLASWLATAADEREGAYRRVLEAAEDERDESVPGAAARGALERGRRFLDAGFRDWAERELEVLRRQPGLAPDVALVLAKTYEEYAMPWRSVRVFERARTALPWETRQERADDFRYLMYPLPYPAQVFDAAAQSAVPAHLIYAIMREESHFEADVVSRAGAVGLMQLMPETAQRVARSKELGIDVGDRLDEPEVNVSIGTWYASDLLRQGDGSVAWMLAAYNAGPGAAQRWLEPGVSGDEAITAVESIDYRETRGYVKRVVESANIYQSLYFGDTRTKNAPR
jgi:soluble lytic murein transglycosylase